MSMSYILPNCIPSICLMYYVIYKEFKWYKPLYWRWSTLSHNSLWYDYVNWQIWQDGEVYKPQITVRYGQDPRLYFCSHSLADICLFMFFVWTRHSSVVGPWHIVYDWELKLKIINHKHKTFSSQNIPTLLSWKSVTSLTDRQCSVYWWQLVIDMTSHHCHQLTASVYYLLWPLGFWVALRILTCGEWYNARVALSWYYQWLGETEPIFPWNYRHINHTSLIYHNLTCWATQIPLNLFQLLNTLISFVLSQDRSNCWWNTVSKFVW